MGGRGASSSATRFNYDFKGMKMMNDRGISNISERTANFWGNTLFNGMEVKDESNNYVRVNRVSDDGDKIIVNVSEEHLFNTRYGKGLILDENHVLWINNWQVNNNFRAKGNEIVLDKKYFKPVDSTRSFDNFTENEDLLQWKTWVKLAKDQQKARGGAFWEK